MDPAPTQSGMELEERRRHRLDELCTACGKSRRQMQRPDVLPSIVQALPPVAGSESLHDEADPPSPYWEPVPVGLSFLRSRRGRVTAATRVS